MYVKNESAVI